MKLTLRSSLVAAFTGIMFWAAPASAGTVTGTITDAANGKPLIAAQISIINSGSKNPEIVGSADSDVDGNFTVEGLTAGTYVVSATLKGYRPTAEKGVVVTDGAPATVQIKASTAPY